MPFVVQRVGGSVSVVLSVLRCWVLLLEEGGAELPSACLGKAVV